MRAYLVLIFFILSLTQAQAWSPHLSGDAHAPETLLVVDKTNQNFLIFSNKSPLRKESLWQCTTGQAHGDKLLEGDLKTPEGIYFLERRITGNHLPFDLYGELAFTLNYPNPVDRIHNKTGHSIWIHGRGKEVVPFDTEGCVAMEMEYMLALEEMVTLRKTPVIITSNLTWEASETASPDSFKITEKSLRWASDWQSGADRYFEYYDPVLFPKSSGQGFEAFKARKKRLFNHYSWMDVYIEHPKVLEGPGYWVSYFGQVFNSPGLYSVGVKRLYWKRNESGGLSIVGEEWRPYPNGYLEEKYLADRAHDLKQVVMRWRDAWLAADIGEYAEFYHRNAVQNDLRGIRAIVDHKKDIWGRGLLPESIDLGEMKVSRSPSGFQVEFNQAYSSVSGYSDYGLKTLVMVPIGNDWLILSESWREFR